MKMILALAASTAFAVPAMATGTSVPFGELNNFSAGARLTIAF